MNKPVKSIQIAIIGYGKMGKLVEQIASQRGHQICAIIDPEEGTHRNINAKALKSADVCIDFTQPQATVDNIRAIAPLHKNIVVGTTGWHSQLDLVRQIVDSFGIGLLYSLNFAIGVNLFFKIVAEAAAHFNTFDEYDIACIDIHHHQKLDSPSGTGRHIAELIKSKIKRKTKIVTENGNRPIKSDELQLLSLRCGSIPGTHEVIFDSPSDTIVLKHTARNRQGFALGAVIAAEWIIGRKGLFTIDDLIA